MRFRNEVVKKEYNTDPSNVEFANPVYASNYFRNAGLRLFAPEISDKLELLNTEFNRFEIEALNPLTEQIKLHLEVQRETLLTLKDIRDSLKKDKIKSFIDEYR
jgi:hypothetical protein